MITIGAFCASLLVCLVLGGNILYALMAGLAIFAFYGKRQGYSWRALGKMIGAGVKTSGSVLLVFQLIGVLTAFWRACGALPLIICCAVDLIRPKILLLMTFLLNCGVSVLTGTAFGTAATMGVISMTMGIAMGANRCDYCRGNNTCSHCYLNADLQKRHYYDQQRGDKAQPVQMQLL